MRPQVAGIETLSCKMWD